MKKIIASLIAAGLAAAVVFTGCDIFDLDDDWNSSGNSSNSGNSGGSGSTTTKHTWKADTLKVEADATKCSTSFILPGDYTKSDFTVNAIDSYYSDSFYAKCDGYEDLYNANVVEDTTITVNGTETDDGSFTAVLGTTYKIVFTYEELTKELDLICNCENGIVESSRDISAIENEKLEDLYTTDHYPSFEIIKITPSGYVTTRSISLDYATASNGYSFFIGEDEDSLTKFSGESLLDYTFDADDKIIKIYREDIDEASDATTFAHTINLTVRSLSEIANAEADFNSVTSGVETSLLSLVSSSSVVTCYDSTWNESATSVLSDAEMGKLKLTEVRDGATTATLKSAFTIEIYDNKELTGTPVATITSSTTADDMWTPGDGADFTTYSVYNKNGTKTYVASTGKVYYVKIIYNDGTVSFESSYLERTYSDSDYVYPYCFSAIKVVSATTSEE